MKVAQRGSFTKEMEAVAKEEGIEVEILRQRIARGTVVIPRNIDRELKPVGIGEGLTTKVNVNIGTSTTYVNLDLELEKVKVAIEYGADTLMDLSTGGDLDEIRRKFLKITNVPFGTVPIYQASLETAKKKGAVVYMTEDEIFDTIEKHLKDGVDFITVHTGITKELVSKLKNSSRLTGVVSRGGAILAAWMLHNIKENPLYSNFDYLLELAEKYDATLSLGDALRPGSIADAHDELQVAELVNNSKLTKRAWQKGIQVMIEGPGHMPLDKIAPDIKLEKILSGGAPYYVLGPLVTDVAAGYDHIASAIGAAIASAEGADLICYLTPAEHLSLPNVEQVKEGLIAAKIAAHAGDIVKLGEKAKGKDIKMSRARAKLNWQEMFNLSYDNKHARAIHEQFGASSVTSCTMCGSLCVYLILEKYLEGGS
ncbi:MAG: phosphomethylpyrimidine synthase ThiC [Candidatus Brockarchaeota archaeon]|nr:phosphomethylpyrimidine synthase ThiC [Candidatus Brockarchaeota archaeon]MBO3767946.1 phosphomethylpyrimidine synthase ThiC [Candidatus Brockarchaeota archaeon]MBO3801228.1 phosphomethylpyrimidine synthase ThiC [Candidatus Brockarchaeota archaeon]